MFHDIIITKRKYDIIMVATAINRQHDYSKHGGIKLMHACSPLAGTIA